MEPFTAIAMRCSGSITENKAMATPCNNTACNHPPSAHRWVQVHCPDCFGELGTWFNGEWVHCTRCNVKGEWSEQRCQVAGCGCRAFQAVAEAS